MKIRDVVKYLIIILMYFFVFLLYRMDLFELKLFLIAFPYIIRYKLDEIFDNIYYTVIALFISLCMYFYEYLFGYESIMFGFLILIVIFDKNNKNNNEDSIKFDERIDAVAGEMRNIIESQSLLIDKMQKFISPIIKISEKVLLMIAIGKLGSEYMKLLQKSALDKIKESKAKFIIIDMSYLSDISEEELIILNSIIKSSRMMGCECVISGIDSSLVFKFMNNTELLNSNYKFASNINEAIERFTNYGR